MGVANVLSTINRRLYFFANFPKNSKSIISTPGLVGVSTNNILVFGCIFDSIVSGSEMLKYVVSIFHFGRYLVNNVCVEPKILLAETIWSPRSEERRVGKECRCRWVLDH